MPLLLKPILFEMPMRTIQQVQTESLCLCINRQGQFVILVLYKPVDLKTIKVYGVVEVRDLMKRCDAWEVHLIAGEQNYGPLMYDLVMSYTEQPLISDEFSVSPDARSVWIKMFDNEQKYSLFQKPGHCKGSVRDGGPLNKYGVSIKQPVDYSKLVNNHNKVVKQVTDSKTNTEQGFVEKVLDQGRDYFQQRRS